MIFLCSRVTVGLEDSPIFRCSLASLFWNISIWLGCVGDHTAGSAALITNLISIISLHVARVDHSSGLVLPCVLPLLDLLAHVLVVIQLLLQRLQFASKVKILLLQVVLGSLGQVVQFHLILLVL